MIELIIYYTFAVIILQNFGIFCITIIILSLKKLFYTFTN